MLDPNALSEFIVRTLSDSDCFLTRLDITADNRITVEIDSDNPVDLDECVSLTRAIEAEFDRDADDYELEVGSAGLTSPLRVPRQYRKYIGRDLEVLTADGRKLHGILTAADDEGFTLQTERKVKPEGAKRPITELTDEHFSYGDVKQAKYDLKF